MTAASKKFTSESLHTSGEYLSSQSAPSWIDYTAAKQEYIRTHPEATDADIQQECQRLAYEMGL